VTELEPDVIIIDTESPSRDVLEHVSVVSARAPRPIVLFTEDGENASIHAALKAGVSAYVVAGIQAERLQPILDVAVARFTHEQALRDELRDAQTKLVERKVIERAKGILMKQKGVSEEQAFRMLRTLAMDRHAKLLDVAQASENSIARFEREVQLTCQLTHPNTIALYDFGRTPEGIFYYAMEFLEGMSLNDLVNKYGRLPEARVIHILRQVCARVFCRHRPTTHVPHCIRGARGCAHQSA